MDIKIIAGILALSVLLVAIGITLPNGGNEITQTFPWQIENTAGNSTRVFGLTLGTSTLREAETRFDASSELSLFAEASEQLIAEAYFDKVNLGGLDAKIIAVIDIPHEQLQAMYQRGARISTLGSGTHKVTLTAQDQQTARQLNIASIAYLPLARLDEALLLKRFGPPAERIKESESGIEHWLYPTVGLDIALHPKGHAVLQYIAPARFTQLRQPLSMEN